MKTRWPVDLKQFPHDSQLQCCWSQECLTTAKHFRYSWRSFGLYLFTGDDTNCALEGKGNVPLLKTKWQQNEGSTSNSGTWDLNSNLLLKLEQFVRFLNGYPRLNYINAICSAMLDKMVEDGGFSEVSKVDLSKLSTCYNSFVLHCKRVHFRMAQWKR